MSVNGMFQQSLPVGWLLYEPSIVLDYAGDLVIRGLLPNSG